MYTYICRFLPLQPDYDDIHEEEDENRLVMDERRIPASRGPGQKSSKEKKYNNINGKHKRIQHFNTVSLNYIKILVHFFFSSEHFHALKRQRIIPCYL